MLEAFHFIRPAWLLALLPLGWLAWRIARAGNVDNPWQRTIDPSLLPLLMADGAGGVHCGSLVEAGIQRTWPGRPSFFVQAAIPTPLKISCPTCTPPT